jgi:hypothetical protein
VDQTINANMAKCIQSVSHLGYTSYHNICTGAVTDLSWGGPDWVLGVLVTILFAIMIAALGGLLFMVVTDH